MEFTEVIKNRFSCKNFDSSKQVEEEKLQEILEAGRVALTAKNSQEQKIYVVETPENIATIDKVTPCRYGANTVLVVAYDTDGVYVYPGETQDSGMEDASIVATHMILAAYNAGVDSCWVNRFDPVALAKDLGLPSNEKIVMLMDLGYASENGKPLPNHFSRKDLSETVSRI